MYLHTEAHNVGQIKHDWALEIKSVCAALDYWLCSVLGRKALPMFICSSSTTPDQGIGLSTNPDPGYLVSFIARAKVQNQNCVLGESKLQSTT